jgi:hypothetical protein
VIPKIIHQIWIGKNKLPDLWKPFTNTWITNNSNYKYILWDEDKIKNEIDDDNYLSIDNVLSVFISDYFRYKILYKYGGFYFDVDFKCLQPIDNWDYDFNNIDFFCVKYGATIQNGIMASTINNSINKNMIDTCTKKLLLSGETCGPYLFDKIINESNEKTYIEHKAHKFFPEWHGINPCNSDMMDIYTSNDQSYSTWYPDRLCPHTGLKNNTKG